MNNQEIQQTGQRDQWKSKLGFILAAAGSAVGLGSIWKFPYIVGERGGGAYVLVYLIAVFLIGIPLMVAEFVIGRRSGKNAIEAYGEFNKKYKIVGFISMVIPTIILSYYCVIGGWAFMYLYLSLIGKLDGLTPEAYANMFVTSAADMSLVGICSAIFLILTILVIMRGISGGIEKVCEVLMPALFLILIILAIVGSLLPGGVEGIKWYLKPDFSKIDSSTFVYVIGQVFFTLSLGMGIMVTYASYLSKEEDMPKSATMAIMFDNVVSLLAGFAIFPAVFAFGLEPAAGPGLVFITLPNVFDKMPLGKVVAVAFYILLIFAALPSAISLMEVPVTYAIEKFKMSRVKATAIIGVIVAIIGLPTMLAFGPWSHITPFGMNLFDLYDYVCSNIGLPFVGIATALILGFTWDKEIVLDEVTNGGKLDFRLKNVWYNIVKWLCPIMLILVFLQSIGIM